MYGNTYAFGGYLLRNYGSSGINIIHEIATNQYINENAITKALKTLGIKNPEDAESGYETFISLLQKFPQVIINAGETVSPSYYINREDSFNGNIYKIFEINLNDFYYYDKLGNKYNGPLIITNSSYQTIDIGGYGFDVHKYGTVQEMKKFEVELPKLDDLDFYIFIQ